MVIANDWLIALFAVSSGYDFGYFVKLLTAESLPITEDAFFELLKLWFPIVYDIKVLMRASKGLKGGLQDVADDLGVCISVLYLENEFDTNTPYAVVGNAHRLYSPGRVRFPLDSIHILQTSRTILQRSDR